MEGHYLIHDIALAVTAAVAIAIPANFLKLPLLFAYIIAGALIGPALGVGWIESPASIEAVADLGLMMLMFILGLEINLNRALQTGKVVLFNGVAQFALSLFIGIGVFDFMNVKLLSALLNRYEIILLAVSASLSSTLIVVKLLSERLELHTPTSRITLGILVMQDLWAVTFLSIQPNLSHPQFNTIFLSIGSAALLIMLAWLCARFFLPKVFASIQKQPELLLVLSLSWCFLVAMTAKQLHLSAEMGALIAGMMIASFPYNANLVSKIASLRDFFITLFFVALGMRIDPPTHESLLIALSIVAFIFASRFIVLYPGILAFRVGIRGALLPTLNLCQLSEFSLVFAALGVGYGQISQTTFSAVVIAFTISSLLASVLIPQSHKIDQWVRKAMEALNLKPPEPIETDEKATQVAAPNIVLLGFFREASSLIEEWKSRHNPDWFKQILVIDLNVTIHRELEEMGMQVRYGDISHLDSLAHFNIDQAQFIICTLSDRTLRGTTPLRMLQMLKTINPKAKIVLAAETIEMALALYEEGAHYVILNRILGARYLADRIDVMALGDAHLRTEAIDFLRQRKEVIP